MLLSLSSRICGRYVYNINMEAVTGQTWRTITYDNPWKEAIDALNVDLCQELIACARGEREQGNENGR